MKKKLLWVSTELPYSKIPHAGGQTFNYYFKNITKDERFDVTLLAYGPSEIKKQVVEENAKTNQIVCYYENSVCSKIKRAVVNIESKINFFNRHANLIQNNISMYFVKQCRNLKKKGYEPDIVVLEFTLCVVLAKEIKAIFPNSKLVASEHDVTYVGYERKRAYYSGVRRFVWNVKAYREKKIELDALALCDLVMPHNSENIKLLLEEQIEESKLQWLIPYYNNMSEITRCPNQRDILFFGAMNRRENYLSAIWFIENVLPKLCDLDVRFVVLGSKPPENLKAYESDRIHITGFVDAIEPFFENAVCLVAPLVLGAGIKVKVLEALSSGIPVITNAIGIEGIPAKADLEYIHCESSEEYANVIYRIFNNVINVGVLTLAEQEFMKTKFDMNASLKNYIFRLLSL